MLEALDRQSVQPSTQHDKGRATKGHEHAVSYATPEAFATDFSWARTFTGFYRLETPHPGEPLPARGH